MMKRIKNSVLIILLMCMPMFIAAGEKEAGADEPRNAEEPLNGLADTCAAVGEKVQMGRWNHLARRLRVPEYDAVHPPSGVSVESEDKTIKDLVVRERASGFIDIVFLNSGDLIGNYTFLTAGDGVMRSVAFEKQGEPPRGLEEREAAREFKAQIAFWMQWAKTARHSSED